MKSSDIGYIKLISLITTGYSNIQLFQVFSKHDGDGNKDAVKQKL